MQMVPISLCWSFLNTKRPTPSLEVALQSDSSVSNSVAIKIVTPSTTAVPWWMILVIVLIIVAVIILFSVYLYRYGLGKMVECGECGALIPENSKRCPKCGTAFESGTAKCSECGAWIPVNSTECPECHAKFLSGVNEVADEDAYNKAMKEQYDEYVNEFREEGPRWLRAPSTPRRGSRSGSRLSRAS